MNAEQTTPDPAWVLTLDASTPRCVIAIGRIDRRARTQTLVVRDDEDDGPGPNQASTRLLLRVEQALQRAGIAASELSAVGCGRGPGTFTGTRVAVASAKGLAYGLGIPVVPVSTLAAMAASAGHQGSVLAVLDARREEVYGSLWSCAGLLDQGENENEGVASVQSRSEEVVRPLSDVLDALAPLPEDLRVVGSGVAPYREALPEALRDTAMVLPGPTAAGLWAVTAAAWVAESAVHPAALEAVYLRASYAEMGINKPKRPFVKSPFV